MEDHELVDHINRLPHGRATYKQLVRELGTRGEDRPALEGLLGRLVERGRLIEIRSGQYVLAERQNEYVAGRLSLHRDGYGFVIPDRRLPGAPAQDIYVAPDSLTGAMNSDRVLVELRRPGAGGGKACRRP